MCADSQKPGQTDKQPAVFETGERKRENPTEAPLPSHTLNSNVEKYNLMKPRVGM
jgi:hypothetical protein